MLEFKLTNTNGSLPETKDKKIQSFSFTEIGKKKKKTNEWANRNSNCQGAAKIWPVWYIKFGENRYKQWQDIKYPEKHKNVYYKLTPIGILFPPSVTNDTKQIFVACRELNNAKVALINGKIYSLLAII